VAMLHDGVIIETGDARSLQASTNPLVQRFIRGEVESPTHVA
jgi:ABC-type transporter Mla maintaining outer membrane lipid asymmetry ATPase subunit MlaF